MPLVRTMKPYWFTVSSDKMKVRFFKMCAFVYSRFVLTKLQ